MRPPAYNGEDVQQISQEQGERNVAMAVCVQLAGRAIIRVVSRCEEAQDNCNLGIYPCVNRESTVTQQERSLVRLVASVCTKGQSRNSELLGGLGKSKCTRFACRMTEVSST